MVVGGGTANAVGPQMYLATVGLFVLPIVEETGFSRTTVTGAFSVAAVGMAIGLIIVAQLVDRFAARYILVPGFVLSALSMALIGLVPPVERAYLIPCFFVGFFGAGTGVPATRAVVSWFDNSRALAAGVARQLQVGQVFIDGAGFNPAVPFGGYKRSGIGHEYGRYGLEEFQQTKGLVFGADAAGSLS